MRTRRVTLIVLMATGLLLALAVPGGAVTYGARDSGNEHPYVGMAVFPNGQMCSGTLVAEDVFVTAAHCTAGVEAALVSFAPDAGVDQAQFLATAIAGDPVAHPNWANFADYPQTYDIGVVELHEPVELDSYPDVAGEGYLDDLVADGRGDLEFTVAGYGSQSMLVTGPPWDPDVREDEWDGTRHVGTVKLVTLDSAHTGGFNLQHSGNPGHGGGTCYGDSGGPVLHEGTLVAVSSFFRGNQMCRGNNGFAHRVDIPSSQAFLAPYLDG